MGYTTDFAGTIAVVPTLNEAERTYLLAFSESRRCECAGGPYCVDGHGFRDTQVVTHVVDRGNAYAEGQPHGFWCDWEAVDGGAGIEWNESEKFYYADDWMRYIVDHFLRPGAYASTSGRPEFAGFTFDHICNGVVQAQGERADDQWQLVVKDNVVSRVEVADVPVFDAEVLETVAAKAAAIRAECAALRRDRTDAWGLAHPLTPVQLAEMADAIESNLSDLLDAAGLTDDDGEQ